jgi:hypothetical protein
MVAVACPETQFTPAERREYRQFKSAVYATVGFNVADPAVGLIHACLIYTDVVLWMSESSPYPKLAAGWRKRRVDALALLGRHFGRPPTGRRCSHGTLPPRAGAGVPGRGGPPGPGGGSGGELTGCRRTGKSQATQAVTVRDAHFEVSRLARRPSPAPASRPAAPAPARVRLVRPQSEGFQVSDPLVAHALGIDQLRPLRRRDDCRARPRRGPRRDREAPADPARPLGRLSCRR